MTIQTKLHLPLLLLALCLQASACGTLDPESSSAGSPVPSPEDCVKPTKLFGWFSIQAKMISWTKEKQGSDGGTLALVFTITNDDRLPRTLSNSGNGILYGLDFSVTGEDGRVYAATEPSGAFAGNEMHAPIAYQASKEGGAKFKVPKGNYRAVLERKFDGRVVQSFACTLIAQ